MSLAALAYHVRPRPTTVLCRFVCACLGVAVLISCGASRSYGQVELDARASRTAELTQYRHESWQIEDGLPQNSIRAVAQTPDGYLWLGTQEGLVRYDGVHFTIFDQANTAELGTGRIMALLVDRHGALWIGTDGGGLTRYDRGTFRSYTRRDGLSGLTVSALYEDRNGAIWIGTYDSGLIRYDGSEFTQYALGKTGRDDAVLALAESEPGVLWIGTPSGVFRMQEGDVRHLYGEDDLPGVLVRSLHAGSDGRLWIGTNSGLAVARGGRLHSHPFAGAISGVVVASLFEDQAGFLWVGTLDGGLTRIASDDADSFTVDDGLTHGAVRALLQDREGNLWIGTDGGGLNKLSLGKFTTLSSEEGLSHDVIVSVLEDREGTLWLGTEGGGLNRIGRDGTTVLGRGHGLPSDYIHALHEDRSGTLWVGTRYSGALCAIEGDEIQCFGRDRGLYAEAVTAIHVGSDGRFWVGSTEGLFEFRDGVFTRPFDQHFLVDSQITAIVEDTHGALWIGTNGSGLVHVSTTSGLTRYTTPNGLTSDDVIALHRSQDDVIWAGTFGGGLCRIDGSGTQCLTTKDGLHNDNVLQIEEDGEGHLWLGSQKGISRVRRQSIENYLAGSARSIHVDVFNAFDGMKSAETNGGTQPSAWRSRDGRLWFSTIRGVAAIDPGRIRTNPRPPEVFIEELIVNGESIPADGPVDVPPGGKNLEIRYTGLSLTIPQRVRFKYRMEPYDETWVDPGTRREAYYTSLPPGTYNFRVMASNNDGVWNESTTPLTVVVHPFFYQTAWFYLLCILALCALGTVVYRLRIRSLKARQHQLQRLVEEQTQELQGLNANLEAEVQRQLDIILEERSRYETELILAKEKAEESARLKSAILMNMSHEIRTPITAILGYAQVLSEEVEHDQQEFVSYIDTNGKRLLHTLNAILDLARLETNSIPLDFEPVDLHETVEDVLQLFRPSLSGRDVALRLEAPPGPVVLRMDRTALERILQNLVGNAVKFTDSGEIVVEIGETEDEIVLKVHDTGVGIGEEFLPHVFEEFKQESTGLARSHEGSGLGLAITRRLVDAMNGRIDVSSQKGVGTTFTVTFAQTDRIAAPPPSPRDDRREIRLVS